MLKKTLVGGAAAALALSSAGIAMAAGGHEGGQLDGSRATAARSAPVVGLACDGGVQKRVFNRITNTPFTFNEASGAPFVPGAAVVVPGPAKGVDTLSIEFSAETQMGGSSAGDNLVDWMGLEVLVNGPGSGRESAIRALSNSGIEVKTIEDVTPLPHNGCRPRKRRRV